MNLITGTPYWVWLILGYLIYVGVKFLKPRKISIYRLVAFPVLLLAIKYKVFLDTHTWTYLLALAVGAAIGVLQTKKVNVIVSREKKLIEIPGSASMLMVLITIFLTKYYFGYLEATDIQKFNHYKFIDFLISGTVSGYFFGQRGCYVYRYFKQQLPRT